MYLCGAVPYQVWYFHNLKNKLIGSFLNGLGGTSSQIAPKDSQKMAVAY
jgi:hypothetical protein